MSPGPRSLHLVGSLDLASGGPTQSVTQLCEALNALGAPAEIATVAGPGEQRPTLERTPVHAFPLQWPPRLRRSAGLAAFLDQEGGRFDLIHVHGLWQWPGVLGRRAAQRLGLPLVISPRGMLEPWSLRQRAWLKRLALRSWEGRNLRACRLLHATSEAEAENFAALGLGQPCRIIPNGIHIHPPVSRPPAGGTKTLLFLSRYHPKKGLDLLLRAWARVGLDFTEWVLRIHGPDPDGYRADMEALTRDLALPRVLFGAAVQGDAKDDLLAQSDLFILPTHSENFGNVVAEALSHSLPAITTTGAPWQGLADHECGWWIAPEIDAIAATLREAMAMPDDQRRAMGARGRDWMNATHAWEIIARSMRQAYASVLFG